MLFTNVYCVINKQSGLSSKKRFPFQNGAPKVEILRVVSLFSKAQKQKNPTQYLEPLQRVRLKGVCAKHITYIPYDA